ncbi:conserved hypothetical protein [Solidesulfovibrio fructosivorans JJ]]|uniref:Uncharacterized protein n=1 Tax=Solidesulfovibrio fructosivorans JJ] TaxID=596151 RepID=E1JTZ2_SOLFR|nr:hypothetical protein [Solidesulfovibrio fructosivorans]EFL52271.1 conserved hypothetical protein [Solidesulfovibrio fructosivorans JJ]]
MEASPEKALAGAIAGQLAAGLSQDETVAHFIRSTYGALDAGELAALVADRDDPQAASLVELLLFPGEAVARALEPGLAAAGLDTAGQERLTEALCASVSRAVAVLPDGTRLALPLEADDVARFVARLAPTRTLPRQASAVINERFGAAAALDLAVAARQTGPDWTPGKTSFLTTLAGRLPTETPQSVAALAYALRFLAGLGPRALPVPALIARHGRLVAQLRRARQQEQALSESNFETLAMTGNRLPYLHAPDIARELALAEAVIVAATGRPAPDTAASCLDMGAVEDMDELLAAFGEQPA